MIDVTRTKTPPASLAEGKRYNGDDVKLALYTDFLQKCYLCETPVELGTFTVDHRRPKNQYPELKCAWTNLFPACNTHRCNERRRKTYPEGGLIDPAACRPAGRDGVEARVTQRIDGFVSGTLCTDDVEFAFTAVDVTDLEAVNTADELDRIHNATGSTSRLTASALKKAIARQVADVAAKLARFEDLPPEATPQRDVLLHELRASLGRDAPYAMLVRSCFAHLPAARELFG